MSGPNGWSILHRRAIIPTSSPRTAKKRLVSLQLGQIEDLIGNQLGDAGEGKFLRLGRSLIINLDYVYLIDTGKQQLVLSDCAGCYHELTASREVLQKLKLYMENEAD